MESIKGSFLPAATQDDRPGGGPAESEGRGGVDEGVGEAGRGARRGRPVPRSEAVAPYARDGTSNNESPGENVGPTGPPRQKEQIRAPMPRARPESWAAKPLRKGSSNLLAH